MLYKLKEGIDIDRWGGICLLISSILLIIREIIKLKTTNADMKFHRIFTGLALCLYR